MAIRCGVVTERYGDSVLGRAHFRMTHRVVIRAQTISNAVLEYHWIEQRGNDK